MFDFLSVGVFKGCMVGWPMPTGPRALKDALSRATSMIDSGDVDNALELLRTEAWSAAENNSHKVQVISMAAEAKIAKGDIDMGNRKMHWQDAHNSYQRALKLEPSNKDIRRAQNKLASMMDEQSISLGKGLQLFDDGNPTPAGLAAVFVGIMVFLVAFKFAGESLEQSVGNIEGTSGSVLMEVSWTDINGDFHNGKIWIELYDETPMHSASFRANAEADRYDGTIFHRIVDGFMIQGGDFENRDGTGGHAGQYFGYCANAGYESSSICENDMTNWVIPAEFGQTHDPGVIAAARSNHQNSAGSQFYLVDSNGASNLDGQYTAFGKAYRGEIDGQQVDGITVIDAISQVGCGPNQDTCTDQNKLSTYPVTIERVSVID